MARDAARIRRRRRTSHVPSGRERVAELGRPMLHIRTTLGPAMLTLYGELSTIDYEVLEFRDGSGHVVPGITLAGLRTTGNALWRCDSAVERDLAEAKTAPGSDRGLSSAASVSARATPRGGRTLRGSRWRRRTRSRSTAAVPTTASRRTRRSSEMRGSRAPRAKQSCHRVSPLSALAIPC